MSTERAHGATSLDSVIDANSREKLLPLLNLLRALTLRHDELGQEIALNEILRSLTDASLFDQAEKITGHCQLNTPYRSTNQAARFFYYLGLTKAMRLDYVEANSCLQQALRKAPERALGFRIAVTKLALVVQLLLGEIPPRSEFLQTGMKEVLAHHTVQRHCRF